MAIEVPSHLLSYEDYAAIDDGRHYQVLDGELIMSPSPSTRHQFAGLEIATALHLYARAQGGRAFIAPMDVVLRAERPAVILQPDVLYVRPERRAIVTKPNIQGPPDLVVEILSPSNARLDTVRKKALYARYAVPELWIVSDEQDQLEVYRLGPDGAYGRPELYLPGDRLESPLLPNFTLDVAAIFPPEDEPGPG